MIQNIRRCEHYNVQPEGTQDHLCSYKVSTGLYDIEYLEALFDGDEEEIAQIEKSAHDEDRFGPLAACSTIWNHSSLKVHCRESLFRAEINK